MRVLGFSETWPKLEQDTFTTFRFPRKDKDWYVGEVVKVVYQPRRKGGGDFLGIAEILKSEKRDILRLDLKRAGPVTEVEARLDGFESFSAMQAWLNERYGIDRLWDEPMQKLTLSWREKAK